MRLSRHQRSKNGREADRRQDDELRQQIEEEINRLPEDPTSSDVERVLRAFRREYVVFARRNAGRLDKINKLYHRLFRYTMVIGATFALIQFALGINVLDLLHGQTRGIRNNQRTTAALCVLRDDLQSRVQTGQRFLRAHPKGIPGIPAGTIKASITMELRTISALSLINCNTVAVPKRHHHRR